MRISERAREFAAKAHASIGQTRKYTGEPYIVHPEEVAELVSTVTSDEAMIAAAYLHDVVEDTPVTLGDVEREFGADVAALVEQLTDVSRPEQGNRAVRKEIDRQHTAKASPRAKTVKLADLISNSKTIAQHDPGFAKVYFREKEKLLEVLIEGDQRLYTMAVELLEAVRPTALRNKKVRG